MDAHAYWLAGRSAHPYQAGPEQLDAFLYSPVLAQLMRPLSWLPWHVFDGGWIVLESGCFWLLTRGLHWRWRGPVLLVALPEVLLGNVYGLLAVTVALGLRHPGLWSFGLLTKVTTGLPGLVWFAARQEWRELAQVVLTTALLVGCPSQSLRICGSSRCRFLQRNSGPEHGPLLRAGVAGVLVAVAARRGWVAVLPVAVLMCVPTWSGENKDFAVLIAAVWLVMRERPGAVTAPRAAARRRARAADVSAA